MYKLMEKKIIQKQNVSDSSWYNNECGCISKPVLHNAPIIALFAVDQAFVKWWGHECLMCWVEMRHASFVMQQYLYRWLTCFHLSNSNKTSVHFLSINQVNTLL